MQNIIIRDKCKNPSVWFKPHTWFQYVFATVNLNVKNVITIHENKFWFKKHIVNMVDRYMIPVINHETLHCVLDNMGLVQESCKLDNIYIKWRNTQTDPFYRLLM